MNNENELHGTTPSEKNMDWHPKTDGGETFEQKIYKGDSNHEIALREERFELEKQKKSFNKWRDKLLEKIKKDDLAQEPEGQQSEKLRKIETLIDDLLLSIKESTLAHEKIFDKKHPPKTKEDKERKEEILLYLEAMDYSKAENNLSSIESGYYWLGSDSDTYGVTIEKPSDEGFETKIKAFEHLIAKNKEIKETYIKELEKTREEPPRDKFLVELEARWKKEDEEEAKKQREIEYKKAEAALRKERAGIGPKEEHDRMVEFDEDFEKGIRT